MAHLTTQDFFRRLSVSKQTWTTLLAAGVVPVPERIGGGEVRVRYLFTEAYLARCERALERYFADRQRPGPKRKERDTVPVS